MDEAPLRITQVAKRAGLSSATLRCYEQQGLLTPTGRSAAGYRLYGPEVLGRLGFIQRAKALGLSLREIRQLVHEPTEPGSDVARLRHALAHKLIATQRRITELESLRDELTALHRRLSAGLDVCGHIGDCECWLPTREEERLMAMTQNLIACSCCGCTCPTNGPCTCCGCPAPDCEFEVPRAAKSAPIGNALSQGNAIRLLEIRQP